MRYSNKERGPTTSIHRVAEKRCSRKLVSTILYKALKWRPYNPLENTLELALATSS
jgi:hypothetical protein